MNNNTVIPDSILPLNNIGITQQELRNLDQIPGMVALVREGGYFTAPVIESFAGEPAPLIEIAVFEDGRMFVRNGHHRCVAAFIGGRNWLRQDEFVTKEWKYADFEAINFMDDQGNGWVTPLDVRTEVRVPDLSAFKDEVRKHFQKNKEAAIEFILSHRENYVRMKEYEGVPDLAVMVGTELDRIKG